MRMELCHWARWWRPHCLVNFSGLFTPGSVDMPSDCRLYLISPPRIAPQVFAGVLKGALKGGDVVSFQLRLKHVSDDEIRRAVDTLRPLVQASGTAFLLNDRPD